MQIMAADVGNSSIKLMRGRIAPDHQSVEPEWPASRTLFPESIADAAEPGIDSVIDDLAGADAMDWFVSSVNPDNHQRLRDLMESHGLVNRWHDVGSGSICLRIDVDNPEAVGMDRLLAAQAARQRSPKNQDTIVIDCGTALTIDLVTRDDTFRGGVIIAGPRTNLRALASMTSALPDLSGERLVRPWQFVGRSTREAILSGAWINGLGAIREAVARFSETLNDEPCVVGTGGGLGPWREELPAGWIIVDNLVIEGLFQAAARQLAGNDRP